MSDERTVLPDRKTLACWVIEAEERAEAAERALAEAQRCADVGEARARLLTVSEAADTLRVGRSTVYELFKRGELSWVQVGARRLVTATEIERFIGEHQHRNRPATEATGRPPGTG